MLEGGAGIGKTTLWRAQDPGLSVVNTTVAPAEYERLKARWRAEDERRERRRRLLRFPLRLIGRA
jgi:hypothetical protein